MQRCWLAEKKGGCSAIGSKWRWCVEGRKNPPVHGVDPSNAKDSLELLWSNLAQIISKNPKLLRWLTDDTIVSWAIWCDGWETEMRKTWSGQDSVNDRLPVRAAARLCARVKTDDRCRKIRGVTIHCSYGSIQVIICGCRSNSWSILVCFERYVSLTQSKRYFPRSIIDFSPFETIWWWCKSLASDRSVWLDINRFIDESIHPYKKYI